MTAPKIVAMKRNGEKIVCITAYDYTSGLISDLAGADLILVGDSLGTVIHGAADTTKVTLDDMVYHVRATRGGVKKALFVADLPFGSYGATVGQAVESSARLVQAGAESVKLEGAYLDEIRAIVKSGVPVMGHLGMTPQSVNVFGGHRVQGRDGAGKAIIDQAKQLEDAGVFGIVLELVTSEIATKVTKAVAIPTIGIGAGAGCDGQIQVWHDVVGLWDRTFKHSKRYASGRTSFVRGLKRYVRDVRSGEFPGPENSF